MVLGIDGNGECVYWTASPAPREWELLNDGTCEATSAEESRTHIHRRRFASRDACEAGARASHWRCARFTPPAGRGTESAFCMPAEDGRYNSVGDCEAECFPLTT